MSTFVEAFLEMRAEEDARVVEIASDQWNYLAKGIQRWMDSWPSQGSNTDTLRVSGMHNLCPREFVLNYWQPRPNRTFDWRSQIMMSVGTHLHDFMQNNVLGPMGILHGTWDSATDAKNGFHPDPEKAVSIVVNQGILHWRYREPILWHEKLRLRGHLDGDVSVPRIEFLWKHRRELEKNPAAWVRGMWEIPAGELVHLEMKTTGSRLFDKLRAPSDIPEYHRSQASTYLGMRGQKKTLFWYINRDTLDSKLLVYEFEPAWWRESKRKARVVWESIRDEVLPDSMMACITPKDARAKKCALSEPCWKKLDFKRYVAEGKERALKEGRELLDLSGKDFSDDVA